jgi:hypothetical protein
MKGMRWVMMSVLALTTACQSGEGGGGLVARAAGHDLTVAAVTTLLAPETMLPDQPEVVMALADLWIDYTLLAEVARADSTMSNLDLDALLQQQGEAEMIGALRDSVVRPDTAISEEDVQRRFALEAPGSRVRARHILLAPPVNSTPAQRDSVRRAAESILDRLRAGEAFEPLAMQYSADSASAVQGGDLGFFEQGQMVVAFDSAAFSLDPGQLSNLVVTPYGFHILRVDEKEIPRFDELGPQFRVQMKEEVIISAESLFVAGIEERAQVQVVDGAADVVRELARSPLAKLGGRASRRALVRYEGDELTVSKLRTFMQTRPPSYRQQVEQATDEEVVNNVLLALVRRELLVAEAQKTGIQYDATRRDSVKGALRDNFRDAARDLGLLSVTKGQDETPEEAIDRTVTTLLRSIIRGERDVIPLGADSFVLRLQYSAEVFDPGVQQVVRQVQIARGSGAASPPVIPQMPEQENSGADGTEPPQGSGG